MNIKFKASVFCSTYNQSVYIEDALNGFCIQKTIFPFVCIIMDDASTDGEQDVIYKYLDKHFFEDKETFVNEETNDYSMVFLRHKTNDNCFFAVYFLKYNHYSIKKLKDNYFSKYIEQADYSAQCEGDDYWKNPDFLQTSVSFLESHTDYSAVFGNKIVVDESGNVISKTRFNRGLTIHDIMRGRNMGLRNLCFRREVFFAPPSALRNLDIHIYYKCAVSGKMKYFDQDFGYYRLTGNGIYSNLDEKSVIKTSYQHYYDLHEIVGFKYQKDYVYYQMKLLMNHSHNRSNIRYCLQLIEKYHVPSKKRYLWYIQFSALIIGARLKRLISLNG